MSITRICDSVATSALGQAAKLNAERPFLLAAFTLCSRSYATAPCPSSAAPINGVQLFNLTSMYVCMYLCARCEQLLALLSVPSASSHPEGRFLLLLLLLILRQVPLS